MQLIYNLIRFEPRKLQHKDVREILEEISDTDRRIKTGEITDQVGLETLLVTIST